MGRLLISDTVAQAYRGGLRDLMNDGNHAPPVLDPKSPASRFGARPRGAIEVIGYMHEIRNPLCVLVSSNAWPIDPFYLVGLAIWSLAGSNSLEWLTFYNERAVYYSDDGHTLCGAFGYRLRFGQAGTDQIEAVLRRTTNDPGTRRAIGIICCEADNVHETREFPCALGAHYFLRDNRLHAVTYMRAQQALTLFPYDVFTFVTLQSYVAARLGVSVGSYYHVCGTYHIYDNEVDVVSKVSSEDAVGSSIGAFDEVNAPLATLLHLERDLRAAVRARDVGAVRALAQNPFPASTFASDALRVATVRAFQLLGQRDEARTEACQCSAWFRDALQTTIR